MITAIDKEAWGYATVLGAAFVALNVVYLPRRFIPMKYLLPGLLLLAVFGIYPVLYTAYSSLTNYGTGHVLSRSQAIAQIQSQSVAAVEGATRYDVTPLAGPDGTFAGFGLYDPASGQLFLGTDTELTELDASTAQLQTLTTTGRTFVESVGDYTGVRPGRGALAARLPGPGDVPDAGRDRGRGDHDLRRAGVREHHDQHVRLRTPTRSPTPPPASCTTRPTASSRPTTGRS